MSGEATRLDKSLREAAVEFFKNMYNAATNQVETVKVSKKRPRSAPVGFKWSGMGPRPHDTFRGARRNKGRNERNMLLKGERLAFRWGDHAPFRGSLALRRFQNAYLDMISPKGANILSRSEFDRLMYSVRCKKALSANG